MTQSICRMCLLISVFTVVSPASVPRKTRDNLMPIPSLLSSVKWTAAVGHRDHKQDSWTSWPHSEQDHRGPGVNRSSRGGAVQTQQFLSAAKASVWTWAIIYRGRFCRKKMILAYWRASEEQDVQDWESWSSRFGQRSQKFWVITLERMRSSLSPHWCQCWNSNHTTWHHPEVSLVSADRLSQADGLNKG